MVTTELINYIKEQISLGQTSESIKIILLNQGWNETDIIQALIQINTNTINNNIQPQTFNQKINGKESKVKYILYFFVGLILSFLGLIVGSIWIMVKEKENKMRKFIPVLLGVIISVVFWFIIAGGIQLNNDVTKTTESSNNQSPEVHEIQSDLSTLSPNLTYQVTYGEYNPPFTIGNTTISTYITVKIISEKTITNTEITEAGKQVCTTLDRLQKDVSQVQVETVQTKLMIFSSTKGVGGTCEEWNSGKI